MPGASAIERSRLDCLESRGRKKGKGLHSPGKNLKTSRKKSGGRPRRGEKSGSGSEKGDHRLCRESLWLLLKNLSPLAKGRTSETRREGGGRPTNPI